jgi:hypothetical protein
MPNWDDLAAKANAKLFAKGGEVLSYSRRGNSDLDSVPAFETTGIPRLNVEFTGRDAPTHGFDVLVASIPVGPQRGDLVVWREVEYQVQIVEPPAPPYPNGTALLGIRRTR